jgi:hypothetical protein
MRTRRHKRFRNIVVACQLGLTSITHIRDYGVQQFNKSLEESEWRDRSVGASAIPPERRPTPGRIHGSSCEAKSVTSAFPIFKGGR